MQRIKTFGKYALIVIAFYIISTLLINVGMKAIYKEIGGDIISTSALKFEDIKGKATYVNGYVEGKIKNTTEDFIEKKYVKIDLYSERGIHLGTKYIELNNIEKYSEQNFRMGYKFTDVAKFELRFVDEPEPDTENWQFMSEEMKTTAIIGTLILLMFI